MDYSKNIFKWFFVCLLSSTFVFSVSNVNAQSQVLFPANSIKVRILNSDTFTTYENNDLTFLDNIIRGNVVIRSDTVSAPNVVVSSTLDVSNLALTDIEADTTLTDNFGARTDTNVEINDNLNLDNNDIYNQAEPDYDTGTLNSNQDTINVSFDLESNGHFDVYLDGVIQYPGEYTVSDSTTITLTESVSTQTDWYVREIQ